MSDEREFLLRSLADLEAERAAGDISDDDYRDLRARYEARLSRSGVQTGRDDSTNARQNAGGARRWGRTIVTAAVVAGVAVGAGVAVAQLSGSRQPGETITGTVPSTSAQDLARAAQLASEGEILEALKLYDKVLAENPEDVAALTYKGWLLRNVGVQNDEQELLQRGIALLEQATDIDPEFAEAWLFRGIIYLRDEASPDQAVDALRLALAAGPAPEVESAARELLAEIAAAQGEQRKIQENQGDRPAALADGQHSDVHRDQEE